MSVPILIAQAPNPALRRKTELQVTVSVAEIVAQMMPGASEQDLDALQVLLVTGSGAWAVPRDRWHLVRPRDGVHVVLRVAPEGAAIGALISALVSSIAQALAPVIAGTLGGGAFIKGLVSIGLSLLGSALINALIPAEEPPKPGEKRDTFSISGWGNEIRRGAPVPYPFGTHRYAPPFAALPYTEIVGDDQYIRAIFCFGYGPLEISDLRLGETPLSAFKDYQIELRDGLLTDDPLQLYPAQVVEEQVGTRLVRPKPRDSAGNVIEGQPTIETPVTRRTAENSTSVSVILIWAAGLFRVSKNSGKTKPRSVSLRIRQRPLGGEWQEVQVLNVKTAKRETFFRQIKWQLPTPGVWEIELTRLTNDQTASNISDAVTWGALQSLRPEYPIALGKPLALVALRIRASYQLNGQLDNLNGLVRRVAPVPDGQGAWTMSASSSPAAAFVSALQGPLNPFPVSDAEIDWDLLKDWHDWCAAKGLKFDFVQDQPDSLFAVLSTIARAGRAAPRFDGLKWGVVIDRPDDLVVDHISPRNTSDLAWQRDYFDPPDALGVPFFDATNGYTPSERGVPWIGKTEAEVDLTEELQLPGKTDPDEIWIEARRRMYEAELRREAITGLQAAGHRSAVRGDTVAASLPMLDSTQIAARVTRVDGGIIELDSAVQMERGAAYGLRFRVFDGDADMVGRSEVCTVTTRAGQSRALVLNAEIEQGPQPGDLVHFGPLGSLDLLCKVQSVEPAQNGGAMLRLIPAAHEIDAEVDAIAPPPWNTSVGTVADLSYDPPLAPVFVQIYSGSDAAILVHAVPDGSDPTAVAVIELEHRLQGASVWTGAVLPAGYGATELTGYSRDESVEIRARGIAPDGTSGPFGAVIVHVVGSGGAILPKALSEASIQAAGGFGHALLSFAVSDLATQEVLICRVPEGQVLDPDTHAIGAPVTAVLGSTQTVIDGDATRVDLVLNGAFNGASNWSAAGGWIIGASTAQHSAGAASNLSQSLAFTAGEDYRISLTISGRTAGQIRLRIAGAATTSSAWLASDGPHSVTLTAPASVATLVLEADSDFDGAIEEISLILLTPASAPSGAFNYHFIPVNEDEERGPASAAHPVQIL
jgi:hypothetical protein